MYNGAFASEGGWQAVAMPLGISFYSFAAIAYLIDTARGDCEVETNFIDCALFLNFFAQSVQIDPLEMILMKVSMIRRTLFE